MDDIIQPMYMPMEEEMRSYLITVPSLVILVTLAFLVYGAVKHRNKAIIWFVLHITTAAIGLYPLIGMLLGANFANDGMTAEENSVRLALAGIAWIVSIVFLLVGVFKLIRR